MRKRKKLLITAAAVLATAVIAGVTYAWFTANSPGEEHIYGSGALQVASGFKGGIYWLDPDTGVMYQAPMELDANGDAQIDAEGFLIYDTSALDSKDYAAIKAGWLPVAGFAPGDFYPDAAAGERPLAVTYRNVATLDAFIPLGDVAKLWVLDMTDGSGPHYDRAPNRPDFLPGIATRPPRRRPNLSSPPASVENPHFFEYRPQPADEFLADPYDFTGIQLEPDGVTPKYISEKQLPGYWDVYGDIGDLIFLTSKVNPETVVSLAEGGFGLNSSGNPAPEDPLAIATKAQLFVYVQTPLDPNYDPAMDNGKLYAVLPGNVVASFTSEPVEVNVTIDYRTMQKYIDNWFSVERRGINPVTGDEIIYRNSLIKINEQFTATQTNSSAVADILGIDRGDLMQAYYDDPAVTHANGRRGDGQFHSWMYMMYKYNERPDIFNTAGLGSNPMPRGSAGADVTFGDVTVPAAVYDQIMAARDLWSMDAYLDKLSAARAALK